MEERGQLDRERTCRLFAHLFCKAGHMNLQLDVAIIQRQKAARYFSGTGGSCTSCNCHQLVTCGSTLSIYWSTLAENMIEPPFSYARMTKKCFDLAGYEDLRIQCLRVPLGLRRQAILQGTHEPQRLSDMPSDLLPSNTTANAKLHPSAWVVTGCKSIGMMETGREFWGVANEVVKVQL